MTKENQQLVLNVEPNERGVITILQGESPKHIEPKTINVEGNIKVPGEYLGKCDSIDPQDSYVTVSLSNQEIKFYVGKHDHYQDVFIGKMRESHHLSGLQVNKDFQSNSKSLAKLLKKYKPFIHEDDFGIIGKLMSFQAKITTIIESNSEQSGNRKELLEKTVDSKIPSSFRVRIPIFEGFDPEEFTIEIWAEATSASVNFNLESIELITLKEQLAKELINEQIEAFEEFGCPVMFI